MAHRREKIVWLPKLPELRAIKGRMGITTAELAQELGQSRHQVSKVLTGDKVSRPIALKIAKFFERPIEDLFIKVDLENPDQATAA